MRLQASYLILKSETTMGKRESLVTIQRTLSQQVQVLSSYVSGVQNTSSQFVKYCPWFWTLQQYFKNLRKKFQQRP